MHRKGITDIVFTDAVFRHKTLHNRALVVGAVQQICERSGCYLIFMQ